MSRKRQLSTTDDPDLGDLDDLPQPVASFGQDLVRGQVLPFHRHRRAQLVFASEGVMGVSTRQASYVIPPQRAVWVPAGIDQ
jgi:hypothetical protein